jgi:uncharacterized membrane protein YkgB
MAAIRFPDHWLIIIGWWEVIIICFLFEKTTRLAIILLLTQMVGTFMPLVFLPEVTFQSNNILPTLEGQYIIKNLIIISAALVLGGEINRSKKKEKLPLIVNFFIWFEKLKPDQ